MDRHNAPAILASDHEALARFELPYSFDDMRWWSVEVFAGPEGSSERRLKSFAGVSRSHGNSGPRTETPDWLPMLAFVEGCIPEARAVMRQSRGEDGGVILGRARTTQDALFALAARGLGRELFRYNEGRYLSERLWGRVSRIARFQRSLLIQKAMKNMPERGRISRRRLLQSAGCLYGAGLAGRSQAMTSAAPPAPITSITTGSDSPPAPLREFRGVWVAAVQNIDWPSRRGLSADAQKAELLSLMDRAAALRLNAVVFHVRPAADALYSSPYEPWSEYLSGQMGEDPGYDPLALAVDEAHQRGMELHAWFNPFRVRLLAETTPAAPNHLSRAHPEWVRQYGHYLWLDPGVSAARDYVLKVISDVMQRYDIDGVHVDDYFYPYPETASDESRAPIPFPDDAPWQSYLQGGGTMSRPDWRRDNINRFVEGMYRSVKAIRESVKVGISPFGIWRPGNPPQIKGYDAYNELFADSRHWAERGWVDYLSPQLYWSIENPAQSFPALLTWWQEQNAPRHVWPGLFTSRVGRSWDAEEIVYQVKITRGLEANGVIHFSMRALSDHPGGAAESLAARVYQQPALVPASPWLVRSAPALPPVLTLQAGPDGSHTLAWTGNDLPRFWAAQTRSAGVWTTIILPGTARSLSLDAAVSRAAVRAIDPAGTAGAPAVIAVA